MTVQELIDLAMAVEDKSMPVRVIADHGQCAIYANQATVDKVTDEYYADILDPEDYDDYDSETVFLVGD